MEITSAANKTFKFIKSLTDKKGRKKAGAFLVEGIKSVRDAEAAGCEFVLAAVDEDFTGEMPSCPIYRLSRGLFDKLSDTVSPQGILAAVRIPKISITPKEGGLYLYCDGVSDPGNLGTLIRTADAAGADGVVLSPGCADIYSPKTVRACMGSLFHIAAAEDGGDFLVRCKENGFNIYAGALTDKASDYRSGDYARSTVIVVGNEANGVSEEVLSISKPVKIPIAGRAESLNAAVAGALLLYEAYRKRENVSGEL